MLQNFTQMEIGNIKHSIQEGMNNIDKLLQLLSLIKQRSTRKSFQQHTKRSSWSDCESPQEVPIELNQTRQQTSYNNSKLTTFYSFEHVWDQSHQEILLDQYNHYDQLYIKEFEITQPKVMMISTTGNWIGNFLDQSDAIVKIRLDDQIKTINNIQKGYFQCSTANSEEQFIQSQRVYKASELFVEFPKHLKGYELDLEVSSQKYLYEMTLQQKGRILIECPNQNNQLIRFLLIKVQEDNYRIEWGTYTEQNIFQSLFLEAGIYILMPLPGGPTCNIYVQNDCSLLFKKDCESSLKSFNLLKNVFQQCRQTSLLKKSLSLAFNQDNDDHIKKQFTRSCYMNYGIVLQIYQNIYEYEAKFIDSQEIKEDKNLLFKEIYTENQIQHRFSQGEKCIQFYNITKKPANLFIPKKRVLMGNQFMENQVYHTVFK